MFMFFFLFSPYNVFGKILSKIRTFHQSIGVLSDRRWKFKFLRLSSAIDVEEVNLLASQVD